MRKSFPRKVMMRLVTKNVQNHCVPIPGVVYGMYPAMRVMKMKKTEYNSFRTDEETKKKLAQIAA